MRYYSSTAHEMTLASGISAGSTTMTLDSVTGLPASVPFCLTLEPGQGSAEEIVDVTEVSGFILTMTRGTCGTTAQDHLAGAKVRHQANHRDLQEPQEHIAATSNVHGVTGPLAGTTAAQTLTNKTISGSNNTITNIAQSAVTGLATALSDLDDADDALSDRIDDLEDDSGVLTTGITAIAGWTLVDQFRHRVGKVITWRVIVTRSGGTISVGSTGDINNVAIALLPAGWRPGFEVVASGADSGALAQGYVDTDGQVYLAAVSPTSTIVNGTFITLGGTLIGV